MKIGINSSRPPRFVTATKTAQVIPHYKGNPLIEALPPTMSNAEVIASLKYAPEILESHRDFLPHERCEMLEELKGFMFPLPKHVAIVREIETMMKLGYVGRVPYTATHQSITQSIYDSGQAGKGFTQTANSSVAQLSASLIGLPGIGKTTVFERYLATLPEVIYHEELNVFQIPFLMFDLPSGSSIKALCEAILHEIDRLVPGAKYHSEYVRNGRASADTLLRNVAYVMNVHCVGLLVCDEIQNLTNMSKGGEHLMSELTSMCNELKVPIFFIGTNKAASVLTVDFRQARRSVGQVWDRIYQTDTYMEQANIWEMVMTILWKRQWTKHPVALTQEYLDAMYYYSQGVLDIAIKLFIHVQKLAITEGDDEITIELLQLAYENNFKLLHPFLNALRSGDASEMLQFEDMAPIGLSANQVSKHITKNVTSLSTGMPPPVAPSTKVRNPKKTSAKDGRSKAARAEKKLNELCDKSYDGRPDDLRSAYKYAVENDLQPLEAMKQLGMAPRLEDIFPSIAGNNAS